MKYIFLWKNHLYLQVSVSELSIPEYFYLYFHRLLTVVINSILRLRWERICLQCRRCGFFGKIPERGNVNPLQYYVWEIPRT